MTDHSSHTTNTLKIPFHHLLFLSFLCGSTDPCPPAAFSRPSLNPPSAVSINASPSSPFRSPRQFIFIQDPPDPRAEESLTRGRRKAWPKGGGKPAPAVSLSLAARLPPHSRSQAAQPSRQQSQLPQPPGRGSRAAGSYNRREESRMAPAKWRRGEEPPKMEHRQVRGERPGVRTCGEANSPLPWPALSSRRVSWVGLPSHLAVYFPSLAD